ncbi:alpha/beta fold hydrolase [Sphingomonas sp. 37zxx]|uniref:alpha/beta fold hydrolase n=1 Tax=Sphingomonas sp. 37zxx TaxID=1550073 RepID=UPI00053C008B|nr:alpha/beta fold hydrolase [Sphingomonas sp. 37zxx]
MDAKYSSANDDAPPLLLLPGLMCDSRIFDRQLRTIAGAMAAADYGDADTLGAMAERVIAAAPTRFALLGHSMGARVALEVMRRVPDRVDRLALVSTGIHPAAVGEAAKRHALRDIGRRDGMAALVDTWLPPMVAAARRDDAALMGALRAMCIDAGLARFEAQIAALLDRPDVSDLLPGIACPVLVATGSADQWSPPEQHRTIAAAIPGAELIIVEGAGHMLPAEVPYRLNIAIRAWLARPAGRATFTQGEAK